MVPGWVKSDRKPDPEGSIPSVSNTLAQNSIQGVYNIGGA